MEPRFSNCIAYIATGHHIWLYVTISVVLLVAYLVSEAVNEILAAKEEVDKRPREDMIWCPKHGPIRKKHCLPLFPEITKKDGEPFLVCPLCYKETVFDKIDAEAKLW